MFKVLDDILKTKRGDSLERKDFNSAYDKYMIPRWITMFAPRMSERINMVNKTSSVLSEKEQFMLLSVLTPKINTRGKYIKKEKSAPPKKNEFGFVVENESQSKINKSLEYVYGKGD